MTVWCCSKKMGAADVYDPADAAPPAAKAAPPPAKEMVSSLGLCVKVGDNFIEGAHYEQEDIPAEAKNLPLPDVLAYCESRAWKRGSVGFFYQQHANGHEIVGFYQSVEAMRGRRVRHGHARGFLAVPAPASELFDVDVASNFIVGAKYEQEDLPEEERGQVLAAVLRYAEHRAVKRGAAGFFYQQHMNGHEILGFYESAEAMAAGEGAAWHGHARGFVASRKAPVLGALVLDGVAVKGA